MMYIKKILLNNWILKNTELVNNYYITLIFQLQINNIFIIIFNTKKNKNIILNIITIYYINYIYIKYSANNISYQSTITISLH